MNQRNLIWMAGMNFLIVMVCYGLRVYLEVTSAILSAMLVAVGLLTFYGMAGFGTKDHKLSKHDIRLAIVFALITMYIVLAGTVIFFSKGGELPPITQTMISHFTTIVGVVIAFYFGAEAYEAANKPAAKSEDKTEAVYD